MEHVNANPSQYDFELVYSTPADYFAAIGASPRPTGGPSRSPPPPSLAAFPSFGGDFLPATFSKHYVRSGFFTSRPASKASDRATWAEGYAAKSLQVLQKAAAAAALADGSGRGSGHKARSVNTTAAAAASVLDIAIAAVDASVGVHQHHDALTGTDLMGVADNYAQMMAQASGLVLPASAAVAAQLAGVAPADAAMAVGCPELNVSVCPATAALKQGQQVGVVLFNPLATRRTEVIAIPVPIADVVAVNAQGVALQSEVHPSVLGRVRDSWAWTLWVNTSLAPLEVSRLLLKPAPGRLPIASELLTDVLSMSGKPVVLQTSGSIGATATVDAATGQLLSILDPQTQQQLPVGSSLEFYTPAVGTHTSSGWGPNTVDCSTAYAFRPMPGVPVKAYGPPVAAATVTRGKLVQQTHVTLNSTPQPDGGTADIQLVVRVLAGDAAVHLVTRLGPLDITNNYGQEAVIRLSTSLATAGGFLTDANGLFIQRRHRRTNSTNSTYIVYEEAAQNYFPATVAAALDEGEGRSGGLAVSFASAHGVTSPVDGMLEVMMHRRLVDHGCRIDNGYQMNDTDPIVQTLRVQAVGKSVGSSDSGSLAAAFRFNALLQQHPVSLFFTKATAIPVGEQGAAAASVRSAAAAMPTLPPNVHMYTLRTLDGNDLRCDPFKGFGAEVCDERAADVVGKDGASRLDLLVRLQHVFSTGESPTLSKPATVDLKAWLASNLGLGSVWRIDETTLSAGKVIAPDTHGVVTLAPMQIRTFIVRLQIKYE